MSTERKPILPVAILLAALLAAARLSAQNAAQTAAWKPLGPFGGDVATLAADPAGVLYATMRLPGVFRSADGGLSWTALHDGPVDGNVAVDPSHPSTLYLCGVPGAILLESTDAGAHWAAAGRGLAGAGQGFVVAVEPSRPSHLYLGTPRGIWRSADRGASWQPASHGLAAGELTPVGALALPARPAGTAFAGTPDGLYRTADGGDSWRLARGLPRIAVTAVTVSPADPRTVYVALADRRVYRSADGGATWRAAGAPFPSAVSALAVAAQADRAVYAGTLAHGVFRSADGSRWQPAGLGGAITALAAAGRLVFAGAVRGPADLDGVFARVSAAGGDGAWQRRSHGLTGIPVPALAVSSEDPDVLWAGTSTQGLFHSRNRGQRWSPAGLPPAPGSRPWTVRQLAAGDGPALHALLTGPPTALWETPDDGASWGRLFGPTGPGSLLRGAPSDLSILYVLNAAGLSAGGLYRSADGGATWETRDGATALLDCGVGDLAVAPSDPAVLYLAGSAPGPFRCKPPVSARVLRSDDGGATWTDVSAGLPREIASAVAVDPRDPRVVYAGTGHVYAFPGDGVWKSTDGGGTWSRAGGELADRTITALLVSAVPGRVYAATDDGRVFRSGDGGASWTDWSRGLHASGIGALVADPAGASRIYAVTANGVWRLNESD